MTAIEWTTITTNPIIGCTKVSPGCKNCYAERMAARLATMPQTKGVYAPTINDKSRWSGELVFRPEVLKKLRRTKKPQMVFLGSMTDIFHPASRDYWLDQILDTIHATSHLTYQILTKRPQRAAKKLAGIPTIQNLWLGTSVESEEYYYRVNWLRRIDAAAVRFLSCEPLLGPITSIAGEKAEDLNWIIAGGESGPGARPMKPEWARSIRDQCQSAGIPLFFKQWGAFNEDGQRVGKKAAGRILDGHEWSEYPE